MKFWTVFYAQVGSDPSVRLGLGGFFATITLDVFNKYMAAATGALTAVFLLLKIIQFIRNWNKK